MVSTLSQPVQSSPLCQTGGGNTRSTDQPVFEAGIDFLTFQGRHPFDDFIADVSYLSELFGSLYTQKQDINGGLYFDCQYWSHRFNLLNGIVCLYSSEGGIARVVIPGNPLRTVPFSTSVELCQYFTEFRSLPSYRVDFYLRDYSKEYIDLYAMAEAVDAENFSHFRSGHSTKKPNQAPTVYRGTRESPYFERSYDEAAKSGGKYDCYKLEAEIKKHLAPAHVAELLAQPDEDSRLRYIQNVLLGRGSYCDRSSKGSTRGRAHRSPELSFWTRLKESVSASPVRLSVPRPSSSLEKRTNFFYRSVSASLSVYRDSLGSKGFGRFLSSLLKHGKQKLNKEHDLLIQQIKQEQKEYDSNRTSRSPSYLERLLSPDLSGLSCFENSPTGNLF